MPDYQFERECRTPYSEAYIITLDSVRVGRIDLHYTSSIVYGALAVEEQLLEDDILDLIETIDEDLVMTADVARDDFVVSVAQGRTLGEYRDESFQDEDEDEDEDESGD